MIIITCTNDNQFIILLLFSVMKAMGNRLPDTLYHQVDGGPENANAELQAICSLMVTIYVGLFHIMLYVHILTFL